MGRPFFADRCCAHHEHVVSAETGLSSVAELLRTRRLALQPEDVGFPRGRRRRTPGLRREEVAALCAMSTAYYSRLERHCGPRPSPMMLAGIARGLRFTRAERDQLFAAAGYGEADHASGLPHIEPGFMHVLDRLADTPVLVIDPIGQVLHQTPTATHLFGDPTHQSGWARCGYYRWFTAPAERRHFCPSEHELIGTEIAADLHRCLERDRPNPAAIDLVRILLDRSAEFSDIWSQTTSATQTLATRRTCIVHSELGNIELQREVFADVDSGQRLLIYLPTPDTEHHSKLQLASVLGHQTFHD